MNPQPHNSSDGVSAMQDIGLALASVLVATVISVSVVLFFGTLYGGNGIGFGLMYAAIPTAAIVSQLITMSRCLPGLYRGGHVVRGLLMGVAALAIGVPASIFCGGGILVAYHGELLKRLPRIAAFGVENFTLVVIPLTVTAGVGSGIGLLYTVVLRRRLS